MTNFEKYKDEILKITESNSNLAKKDGVVVACVDLDCKECDFNNGGNCRKNQFNWLCKDDGKDSNCCDGCKYEHKAEYESPCTECRNNYTSKFERRPKKTRQDEFLEHYPNAKKCYGVIDICSKDLERCYGVIDICPKDLDMHFNCRAQESLSGGCTTCCQDYWLQEVE